MPHVLILCVHRPDRSPGQRFRFEQYLGYLEEQGYTFDFAFLLDAHDDRVFYSQGSLGAKAWLVGRCLLARLGLLLKWRRYDLVFVQREAIMLGTAFVERFLGARLPLIFDFDDSIFMRQPDVETANSKLAFLKRPGKTAAIIRRSALVFAGNRYLAEYARPHASVVEVVPTTIDTELYQPRGERPPGPVCIGWSGSFTTIPHFKLAIPALLEVRQRFGDRVRFCVLGDGNYRCPELALEGLPWRAATEVADLQALDVGIMPLADDEWARGKCGLKGLQYMALAIPTLMSPVGVNAEIVAPGVNGYLPRTQEEWVDCLSRLVESPSERARLGQAGRATVVERFSVVSQRERYRALFGEALRLGPRRS